MRSLLILFIIFLNISPCQAAFKSSKEAITPKDACNPQAQPDDIILPMPCGLSLALRAVNVPSGALLRDKSFSMGVAENQNPERQIYERQFPAHISAPFMAQDLPKNWLKTIGDSKTDSWYFIGKYEISQMQWDAVMQALNKDGEENPQMCPTAATVDAAKPVTNISWFEAQHFFNKYNLWLLKNHPKALPLFKGTQNTAFLRLPTEEEWEYAARGGAHVPPEWWIEQDLFPLADGKTIADYAVISEHDIKSSPLTIGKRLPNPLGLHDTAGNASEMVEGLFRMSVADMSNGQIMRRLHGAAGGIVTKGGSFRNSPDAAMPGAREETPLFTASGVNRQPDLGLRVALGGINIPGAQKLSQLRNENENFTADEKPIIQGNTPDELIKAIAERIDPNLRPSLEKLQAGLKDQEEAQKAEDRKNLEQSFRSLLYQAETLRAFAFRYSAAHQQLDKVRTLLAQAISHDNRTRARQLLSMGEKDLKDYQQSLMMGANYYKSTLGSICQKPKKELDALFEQVKQEYGGGTIFDEHMRQNIDKLAEYLAQAQKRGINSLDTKKILKGILPEKHYNLLSL